MLVEFMTRLDIHKLASDAAFAALDKNKLESDQSALSAFTSSGFPIEEYGYFKDQFEVTLSAYRNLRVQEVKTKE